MKQPTLFLLGIQNNNVVPPSRSLLSSPLRWLKHPNFKLTGSPGTCFLNSCLCQARSFEFTHPGRVLPHTWGSTSILESRGSWWQRDLAWAWRSCLALRAHTTGSGAALPGPWIGSSALLSTPTWERVVLSHHQALLDWGWPFPFCFSVH